MGRNVAILIVVIVVVAAVAGYYITSGMGSSPKTSTTTGATQSTIQIASGTGASNGALNFSPQSIKVVVGVNNTISWVNNDNTEHTITFTSAPSGVSTSSISDSNNLTPGNTYTVTLTTPGTYQFHCQFHSFMQGTITVLMVS